MQKLFLTFAVEGALLGLLTLVLIGLSGLLRRRYGSRWLSQVWLVLALVALVPLRLLLPGAPAPVRLDPPAVLFEPVTEEGQNLPLNERTEFSQETVQIAVKPQETVQQPVAPQPEMPAEKKLVRLAPLDLLAALWLAGVFLLILWQWGGYLLWRYWALRCALQAPAAWQSALKQAWAAQRGTRQPRLLASRAIHGILVMGFFSPVLLVPEGTQPGPDAPCLLAHELAHLRRHDLFRKALFVTVRALYWYNPVFWLLMSRAAQDLESACDAAALAVLGAARRDEYAAVLLRAAQQARTPMLASGFGMSSRQLRARLTRLFDTRAKQRGALPLAMLGSAAVLVCGLVACGEPVTELSQSGAGLSAVPVATPAPVNLEGEEEVWPSVYFAVSDFDPDYGYATGNPDFIQTFRNAPVALIGFFAGYASPDGQYAGLVNQDETDGSRLILWNTTDGGASWTPVELDCSDWLAQMAEKYGWNARSDGAVGQAQMIPSLYQFVNPTTGYLVIYGNYRYSSPAGEELLAGDLIILQTTDSGASWQVRYTGDGSDMANIGERLLLGSHKPFAFLNKKTGYLAYHGNAETGDHFILLRTTDGGANWQRVDLTEVEQTLPDTMKEKLHACGVFGMEFPPARELMELDHPGNLVLSTTSFETVCKGYLYTCDFGESWQWIERK